MVSEKKNSFLTFCSVKNVKNIRTFWPTILKLVVFLIMAARFRQVVEVSMSVMFFSETQYSFVKGER